MKSVTASGQVLGLLLLLGAEGVSAGTVGYEYDALHRLTRVTYANGSVIQYTYDPAGNRLTRTVTASRTPSTRTTTTTACRMSTSRRMALIR